MTQARLPTSVVVSLGLHGGAVVLFGLLLREAPQQRARMVEGVDLLIQAPKARSAQAPSARKPPPLSTMDFLKLALPSAPRAAAPSRLSLSVPERKVSLAAVPRLEERAKKDLGQKIMPLDVSNRPADAARLDVKIERRRAAATLAALPRLEEVGRKRVKDLPQALALEDGRREAVAAQGLPDVALKPTSRRQALAAVAALQEAASEERAPERKGLAALLPEKPTLMEARPQAAIVPKLEKIVPSPKPARRGAAQADVARKKGVEIEGPLSDRAVAFSAVPEFPEWAKSQGILEAAVSIRFTVDETGGVMPGLRVTNSSSYGRLDKLAMESLKNWRFAAKPGAGVEWGVITFRFVLE